MDERNYAVAAQMLRGLGVDRVELLQFGQTFGVQGLGGRLVSEAALRERGVARYASIDNCD